MTLHSSHYPKRTPRWAQVLLADLNNLDAAVWRLIAPVRLVGVFANKASALICNPYHQLVKMLHALLMYYNVTQNITNMAEIGIIFIPKFCDRYTRDINKNIYDFLYFNWYIIRNLEVSTDQHMLHFSARKLTNLTVTHPNGPHGPKFMMLLLSCAQRVMSQALSRHLEKSPSPEW